MACKYKGRVWDNGWCNVACRYCTLTQESTCEHNKQTNIGWIKNMTEKELIEFIGHNSLCDRVQREAGNWCNNHNCEDCLQEWLQQPSE